MALFGRFSTFNLNKYYVLLGLKPGASTEDVKAAFNKLAKEYHPDTTTLSDKIIASDHFKAVTEARDILLQRKENTMSTQAQYYEDFKKQQDKWANSQSYNHQQWGNRNSNQKEYDEAWEQHKTQWKNREQTEYSSGFAELTFLATVFGFFALVYAYYAFESTLKREPMYVHREKPKFERGYVDPDTHEFKPRTKRKDVIFHYEGETGPHKRYLQVSSALLGGNTLFKCMTCHIIISKSFIGDHVKEHQIVYEL